MKSRAAGATLPLRAPSDFDWVLDRLPSAVLVIDEELDVVYRNLAAQRLFHPERLRVGQMLAELGTEPPLRGEASRLFATGVLVEQELVHEDGRTFAVDGSVHAQSGHGLLRILDVTARARRTRAAEDFVVNAAHEFLSPLTALATSAHVLQASLRKQQEEEVRERFMGHVVEATDRLIAISRALLVLARAEAGVEPPRLEAVRLKPLLAEVVGRMSRGVMLDCPAGTTVLADVDLLRQALVNVVENAVRHSPRGVDVIARNAGSAIVEIDVQDTGTGILPEHLDRVVSRFFTAGGRDGGGFGIGLSIAARAVEVIGGRLRLQSDHTGTRARIEVPSAHFAA